MKALLIALLALSFNLAAEEDAQKPDFDSLGGNAEILQRAKELEPEKKISIVQPRTVSRRHRIEIAPEYSGAFGGETYTRTTSLGMNVNYHFTPRISVGLKWSYKFNTLTEEGEGRFRDAYNDYLADPANPATPYPQVDHAKTETLGLVHWYPIYGKLNLFNARVVQFDVYAVAGGGNIELKSGRTSTYTGGGGLGFWLSPKLSARFEMRYQTYSAQYFNEKRDLDLTVGSMQMGWIL